MLFTFPLPPLPFHPCFYEDAPTPNLDFQNLLFSIKITENNEVFRNVSQVLDS